jgi:hypothetical protein
MGNDRIRRFLFRLRLTIFEICETAVFVVFVLFLAIYAIVHIIQLGRNHL